MVKPIKSLLCSLHLVCLTLALTACGGSGSSSSSSGASNTPAQEPARTSVSDGVNGPLDQAQTPMSEDVFGPIVAGAEGTSLQGSLDCMRQAVVIDTLDVLDSIALALSEAGTTQDPAVFEAAAANIQFSLGELANDLPGALGVVTGADCNSSGDGSSGGNPLAGTPLEPLGAALAPVLSQFPSGGSTGQDADLYALAILTNELAMAFQSGVNQLPAEVQSAPFIGGALLTLNTALTDINSTMYWFSRYNGAAAATELEGALNRALVNTLTELVPLTTLENQAGQPGVLSGPIITGVNQLTSAFGSNLLSVALPQLTSAMDNDLAPILDPIENTLLPAILLAAYSGLDESQGGDPLSLLLGPVTQGLSGGIGGSTPTGTPLDLLLGPLVAISGGSTSCPFTGTTLESGCTLYSVLP